MNQYEVILNGPALGLANGANIKIVEADRFEDDVASGQKTFFVGDEIVAQFSHVLGVSLVTV